MNIRQTRTFALLELSGPAFEEVKGKLTAAGYSHAFTEVDGKPVIDMHGIAVVAEAETQRCNWVSGYGNRCMLPMGHQPEDEHAIRPTADQLPGERV
jgi:hypothetical protein